MRLTTLTLSGFKSFAKTTTLHFPSPVSAIVGPNGSGKSNVAEAIRWVLGEQSLKSLRGRRGEDLIFHGSAKTNRMGKAAVALTFANRDRAIPVDFDEVRLERKIFRDGTNEYAINGSPVRLKDVVLLLARMGLGETKHNIIGQGEVDRTLAAPPRERRILLEEAIGLRVYQLRKHEAERKLEETERNTREVEALRREIAPHVKFLKSQAEKAEKREVVRRELDECYRTFIRKERDSIRELTERWERDTTAARTKLDALEREINAASRAIAGGAEEDPASRLAAREGELKTLEEKRRELERVLGRVEGRLESALPGRERSAQRVDVAGVEAALGPTLKELKSALVLHDASALHRLIERAAGAIESLLQGLRRTGGSGERDPQNALIGEKAALEKELALVDETLGPLRRELTDGIQAVKRAREGFAAEWQRLREQEEAAGALRAGLQRLAFEGERIQGQRRELEAVLRESGLSHERLEGGISPSDELETGELKRKIERLRARLEEIGGIEPAVLAEYRETKSRYDFLERELGDLAAAGRDLRTLVGELEARMEHDFKAGFSKIREAFNSYFRIIFGGGNGVIEYVPLRKAAASDDPEADQSTETEYGIEVDVDVPRKRIKGLAMLSGGERALVSAALLFAITAVHPPPFLVLDETDAALDEANSQKYAAILKELSKKTQLILITHNRETMKQAGILYGVTMGEDGISKILSLKLEEAESYGNR